MREACPKCDWREVCALGTSNSQGFSPARWIMRLSAKYLLLVFALSMPASVLGQSVGQVECPRSGGYVYLYSSMITMDVRGTLQCGEQVQITGRYDTYFGVRTAKGEVGYVPLDSVLLIKDKPGPNQPMALPQKPARELTPYDEHAAQPPSVKTVPSGFDLTLANGTPVHLKLGKTISTASSHVGDVVELHAAEEVVVEGITVVPIGATAIGIVTEVEPKKRLGRGGKLALSINFLRLGNSEKAAVRSFQETSESSPLAGAGASQGHGKDIVFAEGSDFTAYVDGDVHLKKETFLAVRDGPNAAPAARNPSHPRR